MRKETFLTDVHNHSLFSFDGRSSLEDMLYTARKKGVAFYGVAEHFDYDVCEESLKKFPQSIDAEKYFQEARRLQAEYAGVMRVLIGAEFGYSESEKAHTMYLTTYEKYRPDFVVNSVHTQCGWDYYFGRPYYRTEEEAIGAERAKKEVYAEYLRLVRKSLDVPYPYDIVAHIGYAARYGPYADKELYYGEFAEQLDEIFTEIIRKGKILEVNASSGGLQTQILPSRELLERYYALGGRAVSYASDAHETGAVLRKRELVTETLKEIGFAYVTVPCRGEYIKVEI